MFLLFRWLQIKDFCTLHKIHENTAFHWRFSRIRAELWFCPSTGEYGENQYARKLYPTVKWVGNFSGNSEISLPHQWKHLTLMFMLMCLSPFDVNWISWVKGVLWDLRQCLATGSPVKLMKNAFYYTLKALFVLKIFKLLSWVFGHVGKRLD